MNRLETLSQFCPLIPKVCGYDEPPELQNVSIYETMKEMCPIQSSVILSSGWFHSKNVAKFEPIFTEEGICFTTNSINSRQIYTDELVKTEKFQRI